MYRRAGLCALGRLMDSSVTRDDVSRDGEALGELDQYEQDHTQDGERLAIPRHIIAGDKGVHETA